MPTPRERRATDPSLRPTWRGWLHLGGVVVLLALSPILYARAHTWAQVGWVSCYVVGVAAMMATSATLHRVRWSESARRAWRRADHSTIFLAIVGTWLTLAGLTMHGTVRLVVIVLIAGGSLIGIAIRQLALDAPKWVNTTPYLVVGWTALAVLPQIERGGGPGVLIAVVAGGVAYSLGALVYALRAPRLAPRTFGYHELFHALTLVGAGAHFVAVALALR